MTSIVPLLQQVAPGLMSRHLRTNLTEHWSTDLIKTHPPDDPPHERHRARRRVRKPT